MEIETRQTIVKHYLFEFQVSIFIATKQLFKNILAPLVPSFFYEMNFKPQKWFQKIFLKKSNPLYVNT